MTILAWSKWFALAALAAGAGSGLAGAEAPETQPPARPPVLGAETAGPGGAIQGLILSSGGRIAGVALWPPAATVEGRALPRGALAVAVRAVLASALAAAPDARPIVEWGGDFVALGADLPAGQDVQLLKVLARVADPPTPAATLVEHTVRTLQTKVDEQWSDPLERARLAAFASLFPQAAGPWAPSGGPENLGQVDAAAVEAAMAAVRRRPVEARVAGPAGLAARVAAALGDRAGVLGAAPAPDEAAKLPLALAIQRGPGDGPASDAAVILSYRIRAAEAASLGPGLAVLVESLSEGPGSLPQRLRVGLGETPASSIEITPVAGGGGVLVLGVKTSRANGAAAWRVLEGAVSSLRALPLNEDAVFRARQRLDEQSAFRATDARAALTGLLRRQPWSWPPADRWAHPVTAADVQAAARQIFVPERQVTVVAGSPPDELLAAAPLQQARRSDWSRFRPFGEGSAAAGAPSAPGAEPAIELAREVWQALSSGPVAERSPGFHASYKVDESTPLGSASVDLTVDCGPDGTTVDIGGRRWQLRAKSGEDSGEVWLPGAAAPSALPEADRLPALVYRTPAILVGDIVRGVIPASVSTAACGEAICPGLRAELGEGSVLVLVLDPGSKLPQALRVWYLGRDRRRAPDEEVAYSTWRSVEGVKLPAEMAIRDGLGGGRRLRLVDWAWKSP